MRLLKFLLGILLLRRLPGGRLVSWALRLGIWSWLIRLAVSKLKPYLEEVPASPGMQAPSGWTSAAESAAPVEAFESANVSASVPPSPTMSTADVSKNVETVTETISESTEIWGASPNETRGTDTVPAAPDPALEEPPELEPASDTLFVPRWTQGDGSLDCPDGFPIKAKASSNIYYEPGSHHYSVAIPDVCFAAAEDAEGAGYRAPRR